MDGKGETMDMETAAKWLGVDEDEAPRVVQCWRRRRRTVRRLKWAHACLHALTAALLAGVMCAVVWRVVNESNLDALASKDAYIQELLDSIRSGQAEPQPEAVLGIGGSNN